MSLKYDIENKLKQYLISHPDIDYVCVQGESVGNVQKNPLKLKENDLYIFNFITSYDGRYDCLNAKAIVEKMGMKFVPIVHETYIIPDTMQELKSHATGKSLLNKDVYREGVVLRKYDDGNVSFKNVSREYLLKHNL